MADEEVGKVEEIAEKTDAEIIAEDKSVDKVAAIEDKEVVEDVSEVEEEDTSEKLEEVEVEKQLKLHNRPTVKQISEKFPEIFKEFPELKHAIFREFKYTQLFPTVEDAQEASETVENYENLSELLLSGDKENLRSFLDSIEETNKSAINDLAVNFLPALYEKDKQTHFKAVTPMLEDVVKTWYRHAVNSNDEDEKNFCFGAHLARQCILGSN